MTDGKDIIKKMIVIGDAAVGKTSLIRRFVINKYEDKYLATIGTKTSKKTLTYKNDNGTMNLTLMIWDILGQRDFDRTQKYAYKGTKGAFIVLDLTRRETLYSFDSWLFSLYKVVGEIPVIVLANKNDLKPKFGEVEINALLESYGFPYYLTSAKRGDNVNDAFYKMGRMLFEPWEGIKKEKTQGISEIMERFINTEIELGRKLTPMEVEHIIIARYCDLLEDTEYAMSIIRKQFKRAGMDFENPTTNGLNKAIYYIINEASNLIEPTRAENEKRVYINLMNRINK